MKTAINTFVFRGVFLFIGCLFLILPSIVFANIDTVQERAYFIDHTKKVTIKDIAQQAFVTYSSQVTNQGYLSDPLWIRIKLTYPIQQKLVLRILPTYLDNIEIYQHSNHRWIVKNVGDVFLSDNNELPVTAFAVAIDPNIDQSYIYIKLVTSSTSTVLTQVMTEHELYLAENIRDILLSIYLGIIFMTLVYSITLYLQSKEKIIGYFSLFTASEFIFLFFIVGFGGHYLLTYFDIPSDKLTSYSVFLYSISGLLFHRAFIRSEIKSKNIVNIISIIIALDIICFAVYLLGYEHTGLKFNALSILSLAIVISKIPFDYIFKQEKVCSAQFALVYTIVGPGVIVGILPFLGVNSTVFWTLYSNLFNGFFASIMLLKLLYDRSKKIELTLSQLTIDNEKEKWANNQQKKLLSMLVHEIKSPLSVLKLTVDRQLKYSEVGEYANRAINNIDELINRIADLDRIDNDLIKLQFTRFNINQLMIELLDNTQYPERFVFISQGALLISSDLYAVRTIINNLIENALKYAEKDTQITIKSEIRENHFFCSVTNQAGIAGVPDPNLVFKKYYRNIHASRVPGTGLGLYLVQTLIGLLNGQINYLNNNNQVTFELWIPA